MLIIQLFFPKVVIPAKLSKDKKLPKLETKLGKSKVKNVNSKICQKHFKKVLKNVLNSKKPHDKNSEFRKFGGFKVVKFGK